MSLCPGAMSLADRNTEAGTTFPRRTLSVDQEGGDPPNHHSPGQTPRHPQDALPQAPQRRLTSLEQWGQPGGGRRKALVGTQANNIQTDTGWNSGPETLGEKPGATLDPP